MCCELCVELQLPVSEKVFQFPVGPTGATGLHIEGLISKVGVTFWGDILVVTGDTRNDKSLSPWVL